MAKAGERETERRRGQRHGKEKTVPRLKVSCFGGRGPAWTPLLLSTRLGRLPKTVDVFPEGGPGTGFGFRV